MNKILAGLVLLCSFSACAQTHKQNTEILAVVNKISSSTVLLNNHEGLVPIADLEQAKIASVSLGNYQYQNVFDSLLNKYTKTTPFNSANYRSAANLNDLEDDLKYFNTVVITLPSNAANDARNINFITSISSNKKVVIAFFGEGKNLNALDAVKAPVIWTDQLTQLSAEVIPQTIFGGIALNGKLATSFSAKYIAGSGFNTSTIRLKYTLPEDADVNADNLKGIDAIANEAIAAKATPGIVVLVARNGKVIFNKAYGNHTYGGIADKVTDIFDLASITKTAATTPTVMRLYEEQKLKLDTNVGAYIPKTRLLPMNAIQVREVMLHQAGFIPYIPFHNAITDTDHSKDSSAAYPTKVADGYYVRKDYFKDVMWPRMLNAPIKTRGSYVYSDISMYVMKDIVERISGIPLDQYVSKNFYTPLGMQTAGFLPRNRFTKDQIVPTEQDTYFRKTLLEGYVHDQGAALVGGVSGHAGLFSSANDLAIIYQMMLNKGNYGGKQYFKPETVDLFTQRQSNVSRRGLGFDRWDPDSSKKYPSELASPQTYGHTGYTGTCVWVDPARNLVYVFLSNRVHPSVTEKLGNMKIRGRIQDVINKAIDTGNK